MGNLLNAIFSGANLGEYSYLKYIVEFLDGIIIPFTVVLVSAAAVMTIVFTILIMKAEDGEKAKEMKKRLIGLLLTVVIVTFVVWIFALVLSNFKTIMDFFRNTLKFFKFK